MKKQSKKLLSIILSIALVIGLMPATLFANAENGANPISGAGDAYENWEDVAIIATVGIDYTVDADTDVVEINTAAGLAWFAYDVNSGNDYTGITVTLARDIDLAAANLVIGYAGDGENNMANTVTADNSWTAIGTSSIKFNGTFDGMGNTISSIYINKPNNNYQGLFGYTHSKAVIKNLGVTDSHIIGSDYVGGMVGAIYGTMTNSYNTGNISVTAYKAYVGGVAGYNDGTIENSYNTGDISATGEASLVGGVIGYNSNTITNSYNTGDVSATEVESYVGGVVGYNFHIIKNVYNTGAVTAQGNDANVGGVVGYNNDAKIINSYNTGVLTANGTGSSIGGVIGKDNPNTSTEITSNYYLDSVSFGIGGATADVPGETQGMTAAQMTEGTLQEKLNEWVETENDSAYKTWTEGSPYPVFGEYYIEKLEKWDDVAVTAVENTDYTWSGDTLTIQTEIGLAWFAYDVNSGNDYKDKTVTLARNMDLLAVGLVKNYYGDGENNMSDTITARNSWLSIGGVNGRYFNGTFDGMGNTVSGLYINTPSVSSKGLFGFTGQDSEIKNVGVINSHVIGIYNTGAVVGESYGLVDNCYSTSTVEGNRYIGGVVGFNNKVITNSYNQGTVSGNDYVGGIAGRGVEIYNSYNQGAVSGKEIVGGVVGEGHGVVQNTYNTGKISVITDSTSTDITGANVGGIIGKSDAFVQNNYYLDNMAQGIGDEADTDSFTLKMTAEDVKDSTKLLSDLNKWVEIQNSGKYKTWEKGADSYPVLATQYTPIDVTTWEEVANTAKSGVDFSYTGDTLNLLTAKGVAWFASSVNGTLSSEAATEGGLLSTDPYNYSGKTVNLSNSIDLRDAGVTNYSGTGNQIGSAVVSGNSFTAIGWYDSDTWKSYGFNGTFDGMNNEISGLYINKLNSSGQGFFGEIEADGIVKNFGITNSNIIANEDIGGVVGSNNGTVQDVYNQGAVSGKENVGGVVGYNRSTVKNSYNTGTVAGDISVGGVVGDNRGTVQDSYNIGDVTGVGETGGVVGKNRGTVQDSYNIGDVTGEINVGGVAGYNGSTVKNTYNEGTVTAKQDVGGVVGVNDNSGTLQNSYNEGTVSGKEGVGGVVGRNHGIVQNTYSTGKVSLTNGSTSELIGGIIGRYLVDILEADTIEGNYYIADDTNPVLVGIGGEAEDDSMTLKMTEDKMKNGTLLTALNAWVDAQAEPNEYSNWSQLNATSFPILSDIPVSYTITVTGGKTVPTRATAGKIVTFTANAPELGMEFDVWTGLDGVELIEGTLNDEVIKIKMPARNVVAEATYKVLPADKVIEDALKELDGITTENAAQNKDKVNEVVNGLSDYIEKNKETIKNNPNALSDLEELEDLYVAANGNITLTEKAPVINSDVADGDKVPSKPVVFSGLALAVFGDKLPESNVELFMSVTQLKSTSEGHFVLDIKPQMTANGVTSDITNDMLKGPVTFKLYLNNSVIVGETAKIKHVFSGMNENGVEGTDYEMLNAKVMEDANGKFIVVTVTQFSMFTVNVPTAVAPTPTIAPTATTSPVSPQTGDNNTIVFVLAGIMLTAILATAFVIYKKKKLKD